MVTCSKCGNISCLGISFNAERRCELLVTSKEHLRILLDLTTNIRQLILRFSKDESVRTVTRRKDTDVTRKIDELAEAKALEFLQDKDISAYLVSEESPARVVGDKPEIAIVLDPVDGTMNFVNSIPFYAVSAAAGTFKENMKIQDLTVGVVRNVPTGEVFSAAKGLGSYNDNEKMIAGLNRSSQSPVISFYSYGRRELPIPIGGLQELTRFRTLGCASLEICYVASGRLDALIDVRSFMRIVDFAAGKIIVEEAGGVFTDLKGNMINQRLEDQSGFSLLAARDRKLHEWFLKLMWG